jgi:hypothetical protein
MWMGSSLFALLRFHYRGERGSECKDLLGEQGTQ